MDDNTGGRRAAWRWRATAAMTGAALILGGCGSGDDDKAADPSPSATSGASAASGSPSASATGGGSTSLSPFQADPARVPRTKAQAEALASAVALKPQAWGAGFRAQQPAASTPGTVAVLDEQCRWERRPLTAGVLASLSRYSEIPAGAGKGELKVTAAVTVHATVLDADERLAATLEEPLRCREQQVRTDERITKLMSAATPYGQGSNNYADDQVVEIGSYLTGNSEQAYRWYVTRLGTVTLAVSVKGGQGYTDDQLNKYASNANVTMLNSVQFELGGDS
ncbi:hypothetical protein J2X68_000188 [Streptomyces sp. 3330]|uniref:hypothetical protein n=1 Tax=Streptomyces sp. 3330 TaxID=2817755 RepID=UPI0028545726|nr:hypothetical protein [Streptomyces sp. 3330]MDR6973519.1 hypothetical protein [Streptomyces sp. 3330]